MEGFLHQLAAGVAIGGVYACMALSLVIIYQATHVVNFAQGEMAMLSTYLAWTLMSVGVPYWLAFAITLVVSFVMGMLLDVLVIRRFPTEAPLAVVIAMVGILVIINSVAGLLFTYDTKEFKTPFTGPSWVPLLSPHELGSLAVTLIVLAAVFLFFRFTKAGLAMRAAAANPLSAQFVGINVSWMLSLGWGLAAAVGAVAGVMTAPIIFLDPNMMLNIIIYAFAGALLGGITNPWGAVIGGFAVGVFENLMGAYVVGTALKQTSALALIVLVVTLKPEGLFGRRVASRV
jgi:branched-chain amino acid transport system permease protein